MKWSYLPGEKREFFPWSVSLLVFFKEVFLLPCLDQRNGLFIVCWLTSYAVPFFFSLWRNILILLFLLEISPCFLPLRTFFCYDVDMIRGLPGSHSLWRFLGQCLLVSCDKRTPRYRHLRDDHLPGKKPNFFPPLVILPSKELPPDPLFSFISPPAMLQLIWNLSYPIPGRFYPGVDSLGTPPFFSTKPCPTL